MSDRDVLNLYITSCVSVYYMIRIPHNHFIIFNANLISKLQMVNCNILILANLYNRSVK